MVNCSIIISLAHFSHQMLLSAPFSNCVSKCFICFPSRFHVIRISSVGACAIAVRWLCLWYSRKKVKLEKETKNNCTCSNRTQNDLNEMNDERGFVANKREKTETKTKLKLKRKEEIIKSEKRVTKTINNYFISVSDSFDGLTPDLTNVSFHFTQPIEHLEVETEMETHEKRFKATCGLSCGCNTKLIAHRVAAWAAADCAYSCTASLTASQT